MRFRNHETVGEIIELATRYRNAGADELVFYDITASPEGRSVDRGWIRRVAAVLDIPFCVAGGIRSVADAEEVLEHGADKISINSPALANPLLVTDLAKRFGSQCVVVGVDSLDEGGCYRVYRNTGDPGKTAFSGLMTADWLRQAQDRGAGEIVLNCMNQDGVREGYDIAQLREMRAVCSVPLVASGGAGSIEHFAEVFSAASVDGALAASVFHRGLVGIRELKAALRRAGIEVRA